jgi:hypothetical protein
MIVYDRRAPDDQSSAHRGARGGGQCARAILSLEMHHPVAPRPRVARLVFALLCLLCTGSLTPTWGVARPRTPGDVLAAAAAAPEHLAPARTPEALELLRAARRSEAGAHTRRLALGGSLYAPTQPLAWHTAATPTAATPRDRARRPVARPSLGNRAPYDATAPPALP